jgi:hypothetical protein
MLARLGAQVTGVDYAEKAITIAQTFCAWDSLSGREKGENGFYRFKDLRKREMIKKDVHFKSQMSIRAVRYTSYTVNISLHFVVK